MFNHIKIIKINLKTLFSFIIIAWKRNPYDVGEAIKAGLKTFFVLLIVILFVWSNLEENIKIALFFIALHYILMVIWLYLIYALLYFFYIPKRYLCDKYFKKHNKKMVSLKANPITLTLNVREASPDAYAMLYIWHISKSMARRSNDCSNDNIDVREMQEIELLSLKTAKKITIVLNTLFVILTSSNIIELYSWQFWIYISIMLFFTYQLFLSIISIINNIAIVWLMLSSEEDYEWFIENKKIKYHEMEIASTYFKGLKSYDYYEEIFDIFKDIFIRKKKPYFG